MDLNIDCYYYIKEVEDKNHKKYNIFCVKNIPLNEKIINIKSLLFLFSSITQHEGYHL